MVVRAPAAAAKALNVPSHAGFPGLATAEGVCYNQSAARLRNACAQQVSAPRLGHTVPTAHGEEVA